MASNSNAKVVPPWANYVPEDAAKAANGSPDAGWPPWANFRPGPVDTPADTSTVPKQPVAEAKRSEDSPYDCCGKTWKSPRQLRQHQRMAKDCAHKRP